MILPEGDPPDNMAMRLNPPDLSKCRTYERYRQELKAWQEVTDIPKTKQGIAIALSLPQDSGESGIREKVFDEIELKDLKKENGLEILINFENMATWEMNEAAVNLVLIPRSKHGESECMQAKQVELKKLKDFDTYQDIDDTGQYRISTTWVLWWKGDEVRARLVARGYEETGSFRTDSPTVCKSTVRILLSVAASKRWNVKTTDIKSAFLQGRKLERRVFLKPPKEAGVPDGKIWELKHCLYGLNDAAREFYFSVEAAMREMGCQQSSLDPALFYFITDGQLRGVMVSHIDDFLHAGDFVFEEEVMNKLRSRFLAGKLEVGQFTYVGFQVTQTVNGIVMDQSEYMTGLDDVALSPKRACQMQEPLMPAEQTVLRELVGRINWAVQGSRPDMAFEMVELSTKSQGGTVADLNRAMKAIRKLKGEMERLFFLTWVIQCSGKWWCFQMQLMQIFAMV